MDQGQLVRIMLSLLLVVGLILAAAWVARRGGMLRQGGNKRRIHILDSQRLGTRASLALVRVDDREILIGITPQHISLLHNDATPAAGKDFGTHLDQARSSS